jgi:hypothetical protein
MLKFLASIFERRVRELDNEGRGDQLSQKELSAWGHVRDLADLLQACRVATRGAKPKKKLARFQIMSNNWNSEKKPHKGPEA